MQNKFLPRISYYYYNLKLFIISKYGTLFENLMMYLSKNKMRCTSFFENSKAIGISKFSL